MPVPRIGRAAASCAGEPGLERVVRGHHHGTCPGPCSPTRRCSPMRCRVGRRRRRRSRTEVAAIRAQGPQSVPTMLMNDPPEHTRYRRLVNRAFTPRSLAWMELLVQRVADELLLRLFPPTRPSTSSPRSPGRFPSGPFHSVPGLPDARREDVHRCTPTRRRRTSALSSTLRAGPPSSAICWSFSWCSPTSSRSGRPARVTTCSACLCRRPAKSPTTTSR